MYKTPAYDQFLLLTNDLSVQSSPAAGIGPPIHILSLHLPSIACAMYESGRLVLPLPTLIQIQDTVIIDKAKINCVQYT